MALVLTFNLVKETFATVEARIRENMEKDTARSKVVSAPDWVFYAGRADGSKASLEFFQDHAQGYLLDAKPPVSRKELVGLCKDIAAWFQKMADKYCVESDRETDALKKRYKDGQASGFDGSILDLMAPIGDKLRIKL